ALAHAVLALLRALAAPGAEPGWPTVIVPTGSAGKTGTKDLLAQVLATMDTTVATPLSHNDAIGLPLTVLRADAATRYLVAEMGAGRAGDLRHLTGILPPSVGLVTTVGTAHLGGFGGSREAVAAAKGELVEALPADGLAVLNADDPYVLAMARRTRARVLTFGRDAGQVRATTVALDRTGRPSFILTGERAGAGVRVTLRMPGEHHVANATAAAAVALGLGADLRQVAEALCKARQLTPGRMEIAERPDGVTVVNDAVDANPDSMRAALSALVAMSADGDRRTVAVLGEMAELGAAFEEQHAELGPQPPAAGVGELIAVGSAGARLVHEQAVAGGVRATLVPDRDAALARLLDGFLRSGDLVLLKGSCRTGLEDTARRLAAVRADAG
ncbi:UDP-N-acetylmuramoyl-tripeptide--D-alanyl-D-alanine ligase, partial [Kitasatospora nipponensis]|uniref:UDP-N-acetylmuramoyl-tripeptide--D-alanyl-D- alanine ligase n=1 Tax=Kitasatospora nipponensis TaxID=258049 RepID=UPI0031E27CC0